MFQHTFENNFSLEYICRWFKILNIACDQYKGVPENEINSYMKSCKCLILIWLAIKKGWECHPRVWVVGERYSDCEAEINMGRIEVNIRCSRAIVLVQWAKKLIFQSSHGPHTLKIDKPHGHKIHIIKFNAYIWFEILSY